MRALVLFLVTGLAWGRPRELQDRLHPEEIKQILGIEDEDVAPLEAGGHYVQPAPLDAENRHIGAGFGINLGPLGYGISAGLGNGGLGYNGAVGVGNFQPYGSYNHYSQYYRPRYQHQQQLQGRTLAHGTGWNIGPVGAGHHVGIGNKQFAWSGGLGWQGNYAHHGYPANYNRYWNQQAPRPIFHTSQLY